MQTEEFTDRAAFLAAVQGKQPRRSARHAREARPDIPRPPRAKAGEGDRQKDLEELALRGWTCTHYLHATGEHWMTGKAGTSVRFSSYREMLDGMKDTSVPVKAPEKP